MNEFDNTLKGGVKETLGAITGDRQVEAEGRVEQRAAKPEDPLDRVTDEAVEDETRDVREEHRDIPRT